MSANGNGSGNGVNWSVIGSLIALAALGHQAITTVDENRKNADADLSASVSANRERIELLENSRVELAYARGQIDEKLVHLEHLAASNTGRIDQSYKELDDKLQRENNLGKDALTSSLSELDRRLQSELATIQLHRQEELGEIRARVNAIDEWVKAGFSQRWSKEDQQRFQDQLGLMYRAAERVP